jgi:hypothetical protein
MASLESLANPLERIAVLPTAMNLRQVPATQVAPASPVWSALVQYFLNDLVISSVDGGAYIWGGGANGETTVRGGNDPSDATSGWIKTATNGVNTYNTLAPTIVSAPAGVLTITNGTLSVPAESEWFISVQVIGVLPAVGTSADVSELTFTASGAGGTALTLDVLPRIGDQTVRYGGCGYVSVGTGAGTTITLGGAYAGQQPTSLTTKVLLVRLF